MPRSARRVTNIYGSLQSMHEVPWDNASVTITEGGSLPMFGLPLPTEAITG
jgi:hypothetical protein